MIRLSVKTLAKYMTASPAGQRKILRDAKFPNEDEPFAMRLYYREAVERIEAYHRNNHDSAWLIAKAEDLANLASLNGGASGARLRHNSRAVRQYQQNFAARRFTPQRVVRLRWDVEGVRIAIVPDLWIRENGKEKIVKFDFSNEAPDPGAVRIISQTMFEGARGHLRDQTNSSVLYLDVPRGVEHRGARAGARTIREIEAACATITAVWDSISARRR